MTFDITIAKADLSKMLARAASAVAAKSPMPIMTCALLHAESGTLTISATDTYVSARSTSKADVKSGGTVCLDARKANEVVKSLPAGEVRLVQGKAGFEVRSGKSKFKLATVDSADFPSIPTTEHAKKLGTIESDVLLRLISQGGYALSSDEARPGICGVLFELGDNLVTAVSTDGARLGLSTAQLDGVATARLSIPARGLGEVRKLCEAAKGGSLELHLSGNLLLLTSGDATLSVRLADGDQFPPYKRLLPKTHTHTVTVVRDLFIGALKRASIIAGSASSAGVEMRFSEGELAILVESEADAADERVECPCDFSFAIGASAAFMAAAVSAVPGDEVRLEFTDPLGPIVVKSPMDDESTHIVMPQKL